MNEIQHVRDDKERECNLLTLFLKNRSMQEDNDTQYERRVIICCIIVDNKNVN